MILKWDLHSKETLKHETGWLQWKLKLYFGFLVYLEGLSAKIASFHGFFCEFILVKCLPELTSTERNILEV